MEATTLQSKLKKRSADRAIFEKRSDMQDEDAAFREIRTKFATNNKYGVETRIINWDK